MALSEHLQTFLQLPYPLQNLGIPGNILIRLVCSGFAECITLPEFPTEPQLLYPNPVAYCHFLHLSEQPSDPPTLCKTSNTIEICGRDVPGLVLAACRFYIPLDSLYLDVVLGWNLWITWACSYPIPTPRKTSNTIEIWKCDILDTPSTTRGFYITGKRWMGDGRESYGWTLPSSTSLEYARFPKNYPSSWETMRETPLVLDGGLVYPYIALLAGSA